MCRLLVPLVVAHVAAAVAPRALAQNERSRPSGSETPADGLPAVFSRRPLTLPTSQWRIDLVVRLTSSRVEQPVRELGMDLASGFGVGLFDGLELGTWLLHFQISPGFEGKPVQPYVLGRLSRGDVEPGLGLLVRLGQRPGLVLLAPVLVHLGPRVRLDTGASAGVLPEEPTAYSMRFPVQLAVHPAGRAFVGGGGYLELVGGNDEPADAYVGFELFAGTTAGRGPNAGTDLRVSFHVPNVVEGYKLWVLAFGIAFHP
ncbi:MAG: hypothetical protein NZ898_02210 [Myxococcota bacterium]|nr:hypothetical protein [Myxococcota bacterium]MDW8361084.1 hypothetical protein [Myxococcales bacterium]